MYNPELKQKFIYEITSFNVKEFVTGIFNRVQPFEEKWGADLCTQNAKQLQPAFSAISGVKRVSKYKVYVWLRKYTRWCVANRIPGAKDGMKDVTYEDTEQYKTHMVGSPSHLKEVLDEVCNPPSEHFVNVIYRGALWLAFMGISEEQAVQIKTADVDLFHKTVTVDGNSYLMFYESFEDFEVLCNNTSFVYDISKNGKKKETKRSDGDLLLRGIPLGRQANPQNLTPKKMARNLSLKINNQFRAQRELGKTNYSLSYWYVWVSGKYYRRYEQEKYDKIHNIKRRPLQYNTYKKVYITNENPQTPEEIEKYNREQKAWAKAKSAASCVERDTLEYERWKFFFNP